MDEGGMGHPHLKDYFYAAQVRYIVDWCKPNYTAKWKKIEAKCGEYPIQSIIGDKEKYKKLKNKIDPIATFALKTWFRMIKTQD